MVNKLLYKLQVGGNSRLPSSDVYLAFEIGSVDPETTPTTYKHTGFASLSY